MGEPQEVERAGTFVTRPWWGPRRTPLERDQPGLLRMEGQAVLPEPLREHLHDPSRVAFHLEDQDRVVGVTDQGRPPLQAGFDRLLEPCVQDFMEISVGEDGWSHTTLGAAGFGVREASVLQHPRVQPFADQSYQDAVTYPPAEDRVQM